MRKAATVASFMPLGVSAYACREVGWTCGRPAVVYAVYGTRINDLIDVGVVCQASNTPNSQCLVQLLVLASL